MRDKIKESEACAKQVVAAAAGNLFDFRPRFFIPGLSPDHFKDQMQSLERSQFAAGPGFEKVVEHFPVDQMSIQNVDLIPADPGHIAMMILRHHRTMTQAV